MSEKSFKRPLIDALNGFLMSPDYLREAAQLGACTFHITINNFQVIKPYPSLCFLPVMMNKRSFKPLTRFESA